MAGMSLRTIEANFHEGEMMGTVEKRICPPEMDNSAGIRPIVLWSWGRSLSIEINI